MWGVFHCLHACSFSFVWDACSMLSRGRKARTTPSQTLLFNSQHYFQRQSLVGDLAGWKVQSDSEANVTVDAVDSWGHTPEGDARLAGHHEVAQYLQAGLLARRHRLSGWIAGWLLVQGMIRKVGSWMFRKSWLGG
eukprot:1153780-Pelagomonas_calceolata.AAC.1